MLPVLSARRIVLLRRNGRDERRELGVNRVAAPAAHGSNTPKADSRAETRCAKMYGPAVRRKAEL